MRRCVGCFQSRPQNELLRLTYDGSTFTADTGTKNDGRGIYLCRNRECLEKSFKRKAWNRIARSRVNNEEIMRTVETALNEN